MAKPSATGEALREVFDLPVSPVSSEVLQRYYEVGTIGGAYLPAVAFLNSCVDVALERIGAAIPSACNVRTVRVG